MGATTARYRIITSFLIVAESVILIAVVPQLAALGQVAFRIVQAVVGQ